MAGSRKQAYIDLYVSAGETDSGLTVRGRALEGMRPLLGAKTDQRRARLRTTWRLFETDELPSVDVEVALELALTGERRLLQATTDDEGFFSVTFDGPLPAGVHKLFARLTEKVVETEWIEAHGIVHEGSGGYAVISDVDDTVLDTGVTQKLQLIKKVLLSTPDVLMTFDGTAALYQRFAEKRLPLIFVSGSPVNLEPRLRAFLLLRGFPTAPLLLKDLGIGRDADSLLDHEVYKLRRIAEVLKLFPRRKFLLIGDSGEHDPEIYGRVQTESPDRIGGVFIHRVTPENPLSARFRDMVVFDKWAALAAELHSRGVI